MNHDTMSHDSGNSYLLFRNLLLLVLSLHSCQILIEAFSGVTMTKQSNKEYSKGYQLDEIGVKTEIECLQRCLENCRCLSFELCNSTICMLKSSSNSSKVKPSTQCDYFEFKQVQSNVTKHANLIINYRPFSINGSFCTETRPVCFLVKANKPEEKMAHDLSTSTKKLIWSFV